jgi:hypothetical protein
VHGNGPALQHSFSANDRWFPLITNQLKSNFSGTKGGMDQKAEKKRYKLHKSGHVTFCSGITTETTNHLYHNYTQAGQEFFSAFNMKT